MRTFEDLNGGEKAIYTAFTFLGLGMMGSCIWFLFWGDLIRALGCFLAVFLLSCMNQVIREDKK